MTKEEMLEHWDDIQDIKAEQNKLPRNNEEDDICKDVRTMEE